MRTFSSDSSAYGRFLHARWDRQTRVKILEVECIVPLTADVDQKLRADFARDLTAELNRAPADGESALRLGGTVSRYEAWTGQDIYCTWYPQTNSMNCEGVPCYPAAELRAEDSEGMVQWSENYTCANGCALDFVPIWDYNCGNSGGVTVDDPGSGGGTGGGESGNWSDEFTPMCHHTSECVLAPPDPDQLSELLGFILDLPQPASGILLALLNDTPSRLLVWTKFIPGTQQSGAHIADGDLYPGNPHLNVLHLWMGSHNGVAWSEWGGIEMQWKRVLCHESAHFEVETPEHEENSAWLAAFQACLYGSPT